MVVVTVWVVEERRWRKMRSTVLVFAAVSANLVKGKVRLDWLRDWTGW
jgi:hypothetical protein